ncbi:hypothetical protein C8Q80DRAFT_1219962 [Daedaleopsis nitida]|nr:hypothetical protein C8Q80DRAFT_1219962 [Daedaleopsis nitida]
MNLKYKSRDHFAPHQSRKFEGYYTRTQLADGATLAIIFCWVKRAKARGNYVLVSYAPPPLPPPARDDKEAHRTPPPPAREGFTYEFFPPDIEVCTLASKSSSKRASVISTSSAHSHARPPAHDDGGGYTAFTISAPSIGHMAVTPDSIEYAIVVPDKHLRVHLTLDAHTPWASSAGAGPMGGILRMSWALPLNWHVRSTNSRATYYIAHGPPSKLKGTGASAPSPLRLEGVGRAHVEKNWGGSFPSGWIWAQAFAAPSDRDASPCSRSEKNGGERRRSVPRRGAALPGVQAYLVGYRSPTCHWDFRPPFAVGLGRLSPFLHVRRDSRQGTMDIRVATWFRRLDVKIRAPSESFVEMSAPLRGGHEPGFAHESFQAVVEVEARRRKWVWGKWEVVERSVLGQTAEGVSCGALEFGGSYYHKVHR